MPGITATSGLGAGTAWSPLATLRSYQVIQKRFSQLLMLKSWWMSRKRQKNHDKWNGCWLVMAWKTGPALVSAEPCQLWPRECSDRLIIKPSSLHNIIIFIHLTRYLHKICCLYLSGSFAGLYVGWTYNEFCVLIVRKQTLWQTKSCWTHLWRL